MSTSADYSNLPDLLEVFSQNFISLRYPFERYEGLTVEAYRQRGASWASSGAPWESADFVYHPEELYGLVFALQAEREAWLSERSA
jgi:hypothetical protein